MQDILILTLQICTVLLTLLAASEDLRFLRIRNGIAFAVALLFLPMVFVLPLHAIVAHVIVAAIVLLVGFVLFVTGLFGGGDAKLLAAVALWLPPALLPQFLLIMAFTGGIVALAALCIKRFAVLAKFLPVWTAKVGDKSWFAALSRGETVVPYGIAIAVATVCTFLKPLGSQWM